MAEAAQASPSVASRQQSHSYLVFLLQVSRPGLWSTTALFYLMPLGHTDIMHPGKLWLGLFFVLFPLGFLLYGVNDIVDAEADSLNPRKGTFMFGSRGAREQLAALKWQIAVVQLPFSAAFYFFIGPRILWWYALLLLAVGLYNAPGIGWKGRPPFDVLIQASYLPSVRRADSGELLARVRIEQLAEQRRATPLADFFIWRVVCHALSYFRRGDGHRARPVERPTNDSDLDRESARQILDCGIFVY